MEAGKRRKVYISTTCVVNEAGRRDQSIIWLGSCLLGKGHRMKKKRMSREEGS